MYIIELQPGVYFAPWNGDPGRTKVLESAEIYTREKKAKKAKRKIKKKHEPYRDFPDIKVRKVVVTVKLLDKPKKEI